MSADPYAWPDLEREEYTRRLEAQHVEYWHTHAWVLVPEDGIYVCACGEPGFEVPAS